MVVNGVCLSLIWGTGCLKHPIMLVHVARRCTTIHAVSERGSSKEVKMYLTLGYPIPKPYPCALAGLIGMRPLQQPSSGLNNQQHYGPILPILLLCHGTSNMLHHDVGNTSPTPCEGNELDSERFASSRAEPTCALRQAIAKRTKKAAKHWVAAEG